MSRYDLKGTLEFLSELALNNNRPWFEEHKADFERAKADFESLVNEMIGRLSAFDDLSGLTAKDCVMRIYRDIRFSRDKTPYKTAFAAHMAAGGRKSGRYGYGLRLEPNATIAAGGMWEPNPEQLGRFRAAVDRNPKGLIRIIEAPKFSADLRRPQRREAQKRTPGIRQGAPSHRNIETQTGLRGPLLSR